MEPLDSLFNGFPASHLRRLQLLSRREIFIRVFQFLRPLGQPGRHPPEFTAPIYWCSSALLQGQRTPLLWLVPTHPHSSPSVHEHSAPGADRIGLTQGKCRPTQDFSLFFLFFFGCWVTILALDHPDRSIGRNADDLWSGWWGSSGTGR